MKKFSNIFLLLFLISGCMVGSGVSDYDIPLTSGYDLVRINRHTVIIGKRTESNEVISWNESIPPKIVELGFNDNYILAIIHPIDEIDLAPIENSELQYFSIDLMTDDVNSLPKDNFYEVQKEQKIQLNNLEDFKKMSPLMR